MCLEYTSEVQSYRPRSTVANFTNPALTLVGPIYLSNSVSFRNGAQKGMKRTSSNSTGKLPGQDEDENKT